MIDEGTVSPVVTPEEPRREPGPPEWEAAFHALLALTSDAVVVGDADRRVTDANAAACALLGITREELVGKALPGFEEEEALLALRGSAPGLVHARACQAKQRDGTLVSLEVSAKVLPDGRSLASIRTAAERRFSEREGDESLWLRAVLDQSPVGLILLHGLSGDNPVFNARAQQMLGPAEAIGDHRGRIYTLDGQLLDTDDWPSSRALRGERTVKAEIRVPNAAGGSTPVAATAAPIVRADGTVIGGVVAFEDITAAKELERLRAEWSSVVAHDLRQPIAAIMPIAKLLEGATDDARRIRYAEHVFGAAKRLHRMVGDLMDLSRLDARRLELVRQLVDVPALARGCIERMALQAPDRTLDVSVRGEVPDADADPDRIAQVIDNLVTNAVKYGKAGTPILVSVSREDRELAIGVTNHGGPLAPEELSRLFERFHRTASAKQGRIEGVGLGLYIARSLVEAHGGRISAESTPAGRTTFRFTLPVAHA